MPIGNNVASVASQREYISPELENMVLSSSVLFKLIKEDTSIQAVSTRPARLPFMMGGDGVFSMGQMFDGASLGLGTAPQEVPGYASCVGMVQATQYTALAEWANDSKEKSIKDYVALTEERATTAFSGYIETALQGAGDNVIGYVLTTGANYLVVHNANLFQNFQYVDIWSAVGGTFRGTVQIQTADALGQTIWLTTGLPAGTIAGDAIMFKGSSGQANTGLGGLRQYQVTGNTGTYLTISKSSFPGMFSTPSINLGGKALTPAVVRAVQSLEGLALGPESMDEDRIAHCGYDGQLAWEENALLVQTVQMQAVQGDESVDMLKKKAPTMMAGYRLVVNPRAYPGFIDNLRMKYWKRIQTKAVGEYEVAGQTLFPAYGSDGGVATSMLFYIVALWQVFNTQPRRSSFLQQFAIPNNLPLTYGA